ncbi:MAG: hypothetical protein KDB03_06530 [Planctomycetales bacterium]|nr:hypothetical protein [Planctomycetales bacterium]
MHHESAIRGLAIVSFRPTFCLLLTFSVAVSICSCLCGRDFYLTIAGGYAPEGNQASLEANVLFYQNFLHRKVNRELQHWLYFADGLDSGADLQILAPNPGNVTEAQRLLAELYRRGRLNISYRNHVIPGVSGKNTSRDVGSGLIAMAKTMRAGDRLVVYVTAHGSSGNDDAPFNTTISTWGNRSISMTRFSSWLDDLPADVKVLCVMAQCYCGGFAHTIFENGDEKEGFPRQLRSGFFAQRFDLPAAGCRPDIEDDAEYSSYFWGALSGKSRNGREISDVDLNADGQLSLAEAHAYAVVDGETIDIPIRGTEHFLRLFSRIPEYELDAAWHSETKFPIEDNHEVGSASSTSIVRNNLKSLHGSLSTWIEVASPIDRAIVSGLANRLDIPLNSNISAVFDAYDDAREARRSDGRGRFRRGRGFSGRGALREAIAEQWPELADEQWEKSDLLQGNSATKLFEDIKSLPEYAAYQELQNSSQERSERALQAELQEVRVRRLIQTLETIVLEANLPKLASPDVIQRFHELTELENEPFVAAP